MLSCMFIELFDELNLEEEKKKFLPEIDVLYVKLPTTVALHLVLVIEVQQGMMIMKHANNQPHQFVNNGSQISFILGLLQFMTAIYCEAVNLYLLTYQSTVLLCIMHFIALEVIMEMPKLYFEAFDESTKEKIGH